MKRKTPLSVEERKELSKKLSSSKYLYFVGIGGSGMYGCARLAYDLGFSVRGTDERESRNVERLVREGIFVRIGETALPRGTDAVVYSLAVSREHPLLKEAQARGILCIDRGDFLGVITERFEAIVAVSGSHGKSSTVGMCAEIFSRAGLSPTVIAGADLDAYNGGYRRGRGRLVLLEACEYRDAFLSLSPTHAVVLNAEWEHTDYFASEKETKSSFCRFLNSESIRFRAVGKNTGLCADCVVGEENGIHAENLSLEGGYARFALFEGDRKQGEVALRTLGAHQSENALAAYAVSRSLGVSPETAIDGLNAFLGIGERMERVGTLEGSPLYLDYAHHPTELRATLTCAGTMATRVVCVFEPHTFSRLHAFWEELRALLSVPDKVGILPVYPARESNIYGVSSEKLAEESGARFLPDFKAAAEFLKQNARENTILLLIGAGRVREVLRYVTTE